jgi:peptidoglycan-associated lipoprotein
MKKILAVFSALFLLTACEMGPNNKDSTSGSGNGGSSNGTYGSNSGSAMGELAPGVADRVFFGYDSSTLTSEGQQTLNNQAAWLKQHSGTKVTVEGHCDERGTREYNLALGERRATAAKKYLVSQGVSSSRVSTISYGKERPAVVGSDESSWSQNRRAVTVVSQ